MSIKSLTRLPGRGQGYQSWTRPADWLALPTVNVGDQKVVALVAVYPGGNSYAVNCAGNYTVDWGDGTAVVNVNSGVQANHTYSYASLSANDTSEGWRQAIVTITMQSGQTFTSINFALTPSGTSGNYLQEWRDIKMAGQSVSSLTLGTASNFLCGTYWFTYVGTSAITTMADKARSLVNLRGITGTTWTSHITSFANAFVSCLALESVPLFDTSLVTDMSSMFNTCTRLRTVPLFNTSSVTTMASMFGSCFNLQTVPLLDTSNLITMASMFANCVSLQSIPLFVTTKVTSFNSTFSGCSVLAAIPSLDTGNCVDFTSMFSGCTSCATWPASLNTAKGTNFTSMFSGCSLMATHPAMTVTLGTTLTSMFNACSLLTAINLPTSTACTRFDTIAQSCVSLLSVNLNASVVSSGGNATISTSGAVPNSLTSLILTGLRFAPTSGNAIQNQQYSASALDAFYTSLGTASGAQSISVSGNPGTTSDTPSIATAKGWTITGT